MISALHLLRIGRAGFVFAREGVFGTIDPAVIPPPVRPLVRMVRLIERPSIGAADTRLSAAFTRLGPSYVKLGQFLATRPDVVGPAAARDLERLQDQMPPFPQQEAEAAIAASFGKPVSAVFTSFGPPVAAASIAQVHKAEVAGDDGPRAVAVKLLRPGIEGRFYADLRAFDYVARHAESVSAEARRLRFVEVVDTLRRTVAVEMDFRLEAAALSEMAENTKDDPDFRVPSCGLGPHHQGSADAGMDRRDAAVGPGAVAGQGFRSAAAGARADPDFSAPRVARRLLSRRHAPGQSVC